MFERSRVVANLAVLTIFLGFLLCLVSYSHGATLNSELYEVQWHRLTGNEAEQTYMRGKLPPSLPLYESEDLRIIAELASLSSAPVALVVNLLDEPLASLEICTKAPESWIENTIEIPDFGGRRKAIASLPAAIDPSCSCVVDRYSISYPFISDGVSGLPGAVDLVIFEIIPFKPPPTALPQNDKPADHWLTIASGPTGGSFWHDPKWRFWPGGMGQSLGVVDIYPLVLPFSQPDNHSSPEHELLLIHFINPDGTSTRKTITRSEFSDLTGILPTDHPDFWKLLAGSEMSVKVGEVTDMSNLCRRSHQMGVEVAQLISRIMQSPVQHPTSDEQKKTEEQKQTGADNRQEGDRQRQSGRSPNSFATGRQGAGGGTGGEKQPPEDDEMADIIADNNQVLVDILVDAARAGSADLVEEIVREYGIGLLFGLHSITGESALHAAIKAVQESVTTKIRMLCNESQYARLLQLPDRHNQTPEQLRQSADDSQKPTGQNVFSREQVGGKGCFLQNMQEAGLPVPPFLCVDITMVKAIEEHPVNISSLKKQAPVFQKLTASASLSDIKQWIDTLPPEDLHTRNLCLAALAEFIASEAFYQQLEHLPVAKAIQDLYNRLASDSQSVIVRSSGIAEDNYGDAQAGRYDSVVHKGGHILRSCLAVLASGYKPEVCPEGVPRPMAIVLQTCVNCRLGGVVMSYSSLKDDTIRVEYAPGQPKGAVAGQAGITPHRYDLKRQNNAQNFEAQFIPGSIPITFTLKQTREGFEEVAEALNTHDPDSQRLTDEQINRLYQSVVQLENQLLCPVDVEFGIDQQDQLCLLQVRPMTRLPGGTNFAMNKPLNAIMEGAPVSEGLGSGQLYSVDQSSSPAQLPEGAIIVADHCYDWMLQPEYLEKAGGFIFRQGGTNDHPAITLRQAEKPCLLAGEHYGQLDDWQGKTVTLAIGQFNSKPGAYLLGDDQSDRLSKCMETTGTCYDPILSIPAPRAMPSPDFTRPDTGFQWLNQQNTRLLSYYQSDRMLYHVLSPERCVQLSMSPRRVEAIQRFEEEINSFLKDAEVFLEGYERFLNLDHSDSSEIADQLRELEELKTRWVNIEQNIRAQVTAMVDNSTPEQAFSVQERNFREWLAGSGKLKERIQGLNQPFHFSLVKSLHDLIYFVHKQFIESLSAVALGSGQGQTISGQYPTIVDFCHDEQAESQSVSNLFNKECEQAIQDFICFRNSMLVNMPAAVICNFKLGAHSSVIEVLEAAEGGKGRTLRLKFSDTLNPEILVGGLKRYWYLAYSLKAMSLGGEGNNPVFQINKDAGEIVVEFSHIPTRQMMQESFVKLLDFIKGIAHLNREFSSKRLDWDADFLDFSVLKNRLQNPSFHKSNEFAFRFITFSDAYLDQSGFHNRPRFNLDNIDEQYQRLDQWARNASQLQSDKIDETLSEFSPNIQKELLHLLLLVDPEKAAPLVFGQFWPLFTERDFLEKAVRQNWKVLGVIPREMVDDNLSHIALEQSSSALQFATQEVKDNKPVMMDFISNDPMYFEHVSNRLKKDPEVALPAIRKSGFTISFADVSLRNDEYYQKIAIESDADALQFASDRLKDDETIVRAATSKSPLALQFASKRLQSQKELVLQAVEKNGLALQFAGEELCNDPEVVLVALRQNKDALKYAHKDLKSSPEFMLEAVKRRPECLRYADDSIKDNDNVVKAATQISYIGLLSASKRLLNNEEMLSIALKHHAAILYSVDDQTKDRESIILKAIECDGHALNHASARIKNIKKVVLKAINKKSSSVEFASEDLRNDPEVMSCAVRQDPENWKFAGEKLKQEMTIEAIIQYEPQTKPHSLENAF